MKKTLLFITLTFLCQTINAQSTSTFEFNSEILKTERKIRIHLPKSYDAKSDKTYPLLLTLDGEYLFYTYLGSAEILSIEDVIPETIIVGIDQNYEVGKSFARWIDCDYTSKTGELDSSGINFKAFIEKELLPYLTTNYHIGKFKAIAGHSFTATYINFFLEDSEFNGFIAVSPYFPESFQNGMSKAINSTKQNQYYFLCTGENDLSGHIPKILHQDSALFRQVKNPNFKYSFKNYLEEGHMSLTTRASTDALRHLYSDYSLIWRLDIDSTLAVHPDLFGFLKERYENIQKTYGISLPYRESDLQDISMFYEDAEKWAECRKVGEMTIGLYPGQFYGYYMIGNAEEKQNNLQSALDYYKLGYSKLGEDVSNKSDFYQDIERVEKLMNESNLFKTER